MSIKVMRHQNLNLDGERFDNNNNGGGGYTFQKLKVDTILEQIPMGGYNKRTL